jgi:hypothetical protein
VPAEGAPTILIDMPTNFVIGQIMMLIAAREVRAQPGRLITVPLEFMLAFSAFVFIPVAAYFFYSDTGWGPIIVTQYFIGMLFGALLAQLLIQRGHRRMVFVTLTLAVIWLVGEWAFTWNHYMNVGTYAEYHNHMARPLLADDAFRMKLNISGAIMAAPGVVLAFYLYQRSRKF